eukprot:TRINITY_DN8232_c0_g1_i2.p1 TRINITY_DN8232_c0_g1~~TRINITY_DN8232_c0_g1_i2.p1  ORF type:complete len:133 (+),score=30.34 TRINITY_DN8232_c0_g1_i2:35-433(+)
MIRRPPRSTQSRSSAASDVYKRQGLYGMIHSNYLGGSTRVKNLRDIASASFVNEKGAEVPLNRFLQSCENAGQMTFRFTVTKQSKEVADRNRSVFKHVKHQEAIEDFKLRQREVPGPDLIKTENGLISRFPG